MHPTSHVYTAQTKLDEYPNIKYPLMYTFHLSTFMNMAHSQYEVYKNCNKSLRFLLKLYIVTSGSGLNTCRTVKERDI